MAHATRPAISFPGVCHTYVNDETPLKPVLQQWGDLGCASLPGLPVCPPRACLVPDGSTCASGVCQDIFI